MRRALLVILAVAAVGACLDFDRFESAAAGSVASTPASSTASGGGAAGAGGAAEGGAAPTCDRQYGDAPAYGFCLENPLICEFQASVDGQSCADICTARGGECLDVFNDQPGCSHGSAFDCAFTDNQTVICVCSRGCGGDPPCVSPDTCTNSTCR